MPINKCTPELLLCIFFCSHILDFLLLCFVVVEEEEMFVQLLVPLLVKMIRRRQGNSCAEEKNVLDLMTSIHRLWTGFMSS